MPNTNFQTIHQMGGAINSFVKQATGRDAVQNIDMEHITVAQNHYYEDVDISGRVVSFNAGAAGIPLEKCLVQIEPVQEGTGDPSPDNVRPISGWTKAKVFVSPTTDEADGTTYTSAFPAEAGTVYGGTLDVVTGELVVDKAGVDGGSLTWAKTSGNFSTFAANVSNIKYSYKQKVIISSVYKPTSGQSASGTDDNYVWANSLTSFVVKDTAKAEMTTAEFKTAMTGVQFVYELATPVTYQLTPQEVRTILGTNNIWADTGDIEVKFKNIKEFF